MLKFTNNNLFLSEKHKILLSNKIFISNFCFMNRQIKPVSFETKRMCVFTFLGLSTNTFFHKAHLVAASAEASK